MKLDAFFDKPKVNKSTDKKVISLSNETKERELYEILNEDRGLRYAWL